VTLLLNHVTLSPGQAMVLGPGNLHAYLHGAGIELMSASDNVVRGGLTTKPVDIDDLLAVVDPTPQADPVRPAASTYPLDGTAITLLRLVGPAEHISTGHELVITATGETGYLAPGQHLTVAPDDVAHVATYV
jgi:mannose-6-phosphate isomerase